jgi:hypothetical protein
MNEGYSRFHANGRDHLGYRWIYEFERGPVPEGLELDHLCRNKLCVNAQHLEAVPHQVNVLRGVGPSATHAAQTHCKAGHEFAGRNLTYCRNGQRRCRECHNQETREYKRRKRAA